jgi:hypothetical protein
MDHPNSSAKPRHTNRLIHETSPYLLQHAHNPVDWYPWGDEAFALARAEDKPILLSIGYAACHWCHVMAHESFEDEETAALMNARYVSIKVDREERPDVDALYMEAVQALTGGGGWPMTVFLMPDGAPFYGGTYFPPRPRFGMPSFRTILERIADLYQNQRAEVEQQADEFRRFYRQRGARPVVSHLTSVQADKQPTATIINDAADRLLSQMDAVNGGFGRAPKFPHPMGLDLLLRVHQRQVARQRDDADSTADPVLLHLVRLTLDRMADGGIYDQIGGGFHRYSTDERWLVPHFEKMLYDNALLARTYLAAWQVTGEERYRRICEETLDYVLREMTGPEGGFYATQDADSEGEEGRFYIWTLAELREALGEDDAAVVALLWGVSERGNFEGRNILHHARTPEEVAAERGITPDEVADVEARARQRLYAVRTQRVWPSRDDKVIAAWNGLMLRAFAEVGRILGRDDYLRAAEASASFIHDHLIVDDKLRRTWRGGQAKLAAYLEDYGALANGLLSLYEADGDPRWFAQARHLADTALERFWDDEVGGFFDTAHDHEQLIGRPRELTDGATPSGTSLICEALLRLAAFTGEARYRERAEQVLIPLAPVMAEQPSAFEHLLCGLDDLIGPLLEIAIVGPAAEPGTRALLDVINTRYLPRSVLARSTADGSEGGATVPLLSDRGLVDGLPTAYVCQGFVCQWPVNAPEDLAVQLDAPA